MKTRAFLAIPLALLLLSNGAQAQDGYWGLSYGMAVPTSDTKDFISNTSWRNWTMDVLAEVRPNTAVGLTFGWNVFNDVTAASDVTMLENVDISGTQYRYINSLPMLLTVRQMMGSEGGARPFVGLGVGTQLVKTTVDVGQWRITDDTWHFAVAPEIGVVLPVRSDAKWFISAKYNYAAKASDRTQSYFGLNIGVAWQTSGF